MCKTILIAIISVFGVSCLKISDPVIIDLEDSFLSGPGVFVLNEGNFKSGNGSLSFYSYDSAKLYNNTFQSINHRPLGDVPYSMNISGSRAYIVVNNSGKIEVVDRNSLISVAVVNELTAPRYISFVSDKKAYVTSLYSDSVAVLDLTSNTVSGYINVRHPSESIAVSLTEAFIAHWAGGNRIFVINTRTDQVVDSLEVGMEPESMVIDGGGTLWVLCNGGWQREYFAELIAINTMTHTIEKRFTFSSKTESPTCLQVDRNGETLFYLLDGVKRMSINATTLPQTNFISPAERNFYKLGVNPLNNEIFVTDASDYQHNGSVLRYNKDGGLISVLQAEIIPGGMCFKEDGELVTQ